MKVTIIEGCISCGLCTSTCPEVFDMGDDGTAKVIAQPEPSQEACVSEAAEGCPVAVIITE
ncbi:MAG: ferredoxin [Ruminococcaceae bacterium]|nr:ferredoxin [Oscillospiraceae bacterium]